MSTTKSIFTETENFAAKLIHHNEKYNSSPDNLPNFTNPLDSNLDAGNDNFTFK